MSRTFRIHYNTSENEKIIFLTRKNPDAEFQRHETINKDSVHTFTDSGNGELLYRYELLTSDGTTIRERHDRYAPASTDINIVDVWRSPEDCGDALRSRAFANAVFPVGNIETTVPKIEKGSLVISLNEPRIAENEAFCIVSKQFMNWNSQNAFVMKRYDNYRWQYVIDNILLLKEFEFKFGIWDTENDCFKHFEDGMNHVVSLREGASTTVFNFNSFNYGSPWRAAGVAVPVFSLRTTKSRGCGEFPDLKALGDWCEAAGLKVIQLLPINDTTATFQWRDSYPYNAISISALHPNFVSVDTVYKYYGKRISSLERESGLFINDLNFYDYLRTTEWKSKNLWSLFEANFDQIIIDEAFQQFMKDNYNWVRNYAAYAMLRNRYQTPNFRKWPEGSIYSRELVEGFFAPSHPDYHKVMFRVFIQFHLDLQLCDAIEYLHAKNIAVKGDLPIGINPDSVEAWVEPELFDFSLQAGAPPDFFSRDGQNWGFPIYNWERMARDSYRWWEQRMSRMQRYFDVFRIDHILGFFRLWAIPRPFKSGLMGIFFPALPLTNDELRRSGFSLDPTECIVPVITREYLVNQVSEYSEQIEHTMFTIRDDGRLQMKPTYAKPDATNEWIEENVEATSRERIRQGMNNIQHEVLFVSVKDGEWHPRIMLTETARFNSLNESDKNILRGIHDQFFYQRHNDFWRGNAMKNLEGMLAHCTMLVCGEDLGMIPASVPIVMQRLQILSLEQQRMPKLYWERYGDCSKYQYMSVCATSSHDISNIRGWWEENFSETQWYYNNVLHRAGTAPRVATEDIVTPIIEAHMKAPSMLCINPIQDYAGMIDHMPHLLPHEERINNPADQNNKWRYRVPFVVDRLMSDYPQLHEKIRKLVSECGR